MSNSDTQIFQGDYAKIMKLLLLVVNVNFFEKFLEFYFFYSLGEKNVYRVFRAQ